MSSTGTGRGESLAIQSALLAGPGYSSFGRWARTNGYTNSLRIGKTNLSNTYDINPQTILDYLFEGDFGEQVSLQSVEIDVADHSYWAEKWMLENYPEEFDTDWAADYNDIEKEGLHRPSQRCWDDEFLYPPVHQRKAVLLHGLHEVRWLASYLDE